MKSKKSHQKSIKKKKPEPVKENIGSWIFFFSVFTIVILLLLLANDIHQKSYSFLNRTWGFDHIEYYQFFLKLAFFIMLILGIILFASQWIYKNAYRWIQESPGTAFLTGLGKYRFLIFLVISIAAGFVFYLVRIKYIFLGDFDIRMNSTVAGDFHRDSYLTMLILNKVYHFLNSSLEISALKVFTLASIISGGLYVLITLLIADLLGDKIWQKILISLFCLLNGSVFIFTGYIEVYPLPGLMVMLSLYLSLLYIKDKASFIFVILAFLVTIGMHLMTVAMLPGILFAYLYKNHQKISWLKIGRRTLIILVLLSFPVLYTIARRLHLIDLIPLKDSSYYSLFSGAHFWELLNSQMLSAGISFLLFLFVLYSFLRKKISENLIVYFLLIQSAYLFFIIFVVNKMRGSADSDITTFPSFIYNILIAYLFVHQLIKGLSSRMVFYILSFTLLFNTLNAASWIGITSTDKSIDKIADMIIGDPAHYYANRMPAELLLAMIYANNDLVEQAIMYYEKSYRSNTNDARAYYNYAAYLIRHDQEQKGIQVMASLRDKFPAYPLSYPILTNYYQANQDYENMYNTALKMFRGYMTNPQAFSRLDREFITSMFNYLLDVANVNNNVELVREITPVLAGLNN
jgi:tetratricopeptide (TPR) repeat protein